MLNNITPVIISFNEQANIGRTLQRLNWANNIVVMDSFSTDRTEKICNHYPNVNFVKRKFDDLAHQCDAAIKHSSVNTEWVLTMDADYLMPPELVNEIKALEPDDRTDAYRAGFVYCINGEPLGHSLYPPRIILARKNKLSFSMDGHAHRRSVTGDILNLTYKIFHDDRKSHVDWEKNQQKYALEEAEKILSEQNVVFPSSTWVRKNIGITPVIIQLYLAIFRGMLFRGPNARIYIQQRVIFERFLQQSLKAARKNDKTNISI